MNKEKLLFILWHQWKTFIKIMCDKSGSWEVEDTAYKSIANLLFPKVIGFYSRPDILEEFEEWKKNRYKRKTPISTKAE